MMDNLIDKYKNGTISPSELSRLNTLLAHHTGDELARMLAVEWESEADAPDVADERIDRIRQAIAARLSQTVADPPAHVGTAVWRWIGIAASVMALALLASTAYFYRQARWAEAQTVAFATGAREHGTVTLPDGTEVQLAERSRLSYAPACFGRGQRRVAFEGEGYFAVAKDSLHPLTVSDGRMQVRVMGTRFNLRAHRSERMAQLALDEGSVLFGTASAQPSYQVRPGQVATLDYATGQVAVKPWDRNDNIEAWRTHRLVFSQSPLSQVLAMISRTYGVRISCRQAAGHADRFDGTLPTDNIDEALRIVGIAYGLDCHKDGKLVVLKASEK